MQDIARTITNSYIPATQWAMNAINGAGKAVANGIQGFEHPQAPSGDVAQRALDQVPILKNIRGFNEGMFGQQAVNHPQVQVALDNLMPRDTIGRFTNGANLPVHPDDIHELAPVIDRMLHTPQTDANYFINQLPQDHAAVQPVAEYYMPGVSKTLKNNPIDIARALVQRVAADRMK